MFLKNLFKLNKEKGEEIKMPRFIGVRRYDWWVEDFLDKIAIMGKMKMHKVSLNRCIGKSIDACFKLNENIDEETNLTRNDAIAIMRSSFPINALITALSNDIENENFDFCVLTDITTEEEKKWLHEHGGKVFGGFEQDYDEGVESDVKIHLRSIVDFIKELERN